MNSKLKIITSMLIFGSIGVFVKNINLSSMEIAFLRAVIGSLFLVGAGIIMKQKSQFKAIKQNAVLLILSGAAIGVNWIMLFQAYKYTTISTATLSYYFAPVFVIILSPVVLKEKLSPLKIVCIIMAMIGLFLILDVNGTDTNNSYNHVVGILYGLSGAALYASVILMNKFIKNLSGFETTIIQLMVSGIALLPSIIFQDKFRLAEVSSKAWIFILVVGVIHTGIAYQLYFTSMKQLKGQSIAILSYIDPISAVIIAAIVLGESMSLLQIVGGVFILGSTFLSERLKA